MYYILVSVCIVVLSFFSTIGFSRAEYQVREAIGSSVKVVVPQVGVASAVAIARVKNKTYLLTNDHVCQMTRGEKNFFGFGVVPLNTYPIYVLTPDGKEQHKATVEVTTNATRRSEHTTDVVDLCIISTSRVIPPALIAQEELEVGSNIFSVSGPQGVFPMIHDGRIGSYEENVVATTLAVSRGSSGGGVFDKETGFLVGLVSSVLSDDEIRGSSISYIIRGATIQAFVSRNLKRISK